MTRDAIAPDQYDFVHRARQAIRNFCTVTKGKVIEGHVTAEHLFPFYMAMTPALHKKCADETSVDLVALSYAMQRLPFEITRAKTIYVKSNTEGPIETAGARVVKSMNPDLRRRTMVAVGDDYLQMVARESESDIYDIVTCHQQYAIEASKMRRMVEYNQMVTGRDLRARLERLLEQGDDAQRNTLMIELSDAFNVNYGDLSRVNAALDNKLPEIIARSLVTEPEKTVIKFDPEFAITDDPKKAKKWGKNIKDIVDKFYDNRPIIVISSDNHSAVNCLTGFAHENREELVSLAMNDAKLRLVNNDDRNSLYYLSQRLCKSNAALLERKQAYEKALGIIFIKDQTSIGIDVQVIDTQQLDYSKLDPRIGAERPARDPQAPVILNIDYAFGKEGRDVMDALIEAFGTRIQSISITGKAGILCGHKYDIMLPSFIVPQIEGGGVYEFPRRRNGLRKGQFNGSFPGAIHEHGPMLTVQGTAIQNEAVLRYYHQRYNTLGLEMEAASYLDSIVKAVARHELRRGLDMYVGYWGSDNPLNDKETLAEVHMDRGHIPTYALMVAILHNALKTKK